MVLIRRMHQVCYMVGEFFREIEMDGICMVCGAYFCTNFILINHCFCFVFLLETSRGALGDGGLCGVVFNFHTHFLGLAVGQLI